MKTLCFGLIDRVESVLDSTGLLRHCNDSLINEEFQFSADQYSYEIEKEFCHFDAHQGLWFLNEPNHNGRIVRFLWRLKPSYCVHGKPYFSPTDCKAIRDESEHKKVLFNTGKIQLTLELDDFRNGDSSYNWGISFSTYIRLYINDELVFSEQNDRYWKGKFKKYFEENYYPSKT